MKPKHFWKSKKVRKCIHHGRLSREYMRADGSDWRSSHHAQRTGLKFITPRARPRCRLGPCVWKCATSGRPIGATLCDHPRVSCCRTVTTRDTGAAARVLLGLQALHGAIALREVGTGCVHIERAPWLWSLKRGSRLWWNVDVRSWMSD